MSNYYTEKWIDADLDEADGETTIFEKGAVDGVCMYTLLNFSVKVVTVSTKLVFKIYKEVYGAEEQLTDEDVPITAGCTEILFTPMSSRWIKITVTPTGNNHSLKSTTDYKTDNLKAALEA